jgi:hypothetical protein
MTNRTGKIAALAAVASLAIAGGAQARHGADDPAGDLKGPRDDSALHLRQGADDPAGHDRRDDRLRKQRARHHRHHARAARHGRGADDPAGHR